MTNVLFLSLGLILGVIIGVDTVADEEGYKFLGTAKKIEEKLTI